MLRCSGFGSGVDMLASYEVSLIAGKIEINQISTLSGAAPVPSSAVIPAKAMCHGHLGYAGARAREAVN